MHLLKRPLKLIMYFLVAGALTAVVTSFPFHGYESQLYDFMFRLKGPKTPPSDIVLVAIDDRSTQELDQNWPLPLAMHTSVLKGILVEKPRLVAYTMSFGDNPATVEGEESFQKTVGSSDHVLFSSTLLRLDIPKVNPDYILQKEIFQNGVAVDRLSFARDGVSRRHVSRLSKIYSIEAAIARKLGYIDSFSELPDVFYTNYLGPAKTFKTVSFSDIYKGLLKPGFFKGKIVLIGRTTADTSENFATTPFDNKLYSFTKLEIHANALQSILSGTFIERASRISNFLVTFFACLASILLIIYTPPAVGLLFLFTCSLLSFFLSFFFLVIGHTWLNLFHPLLVIFICYYVLIPYRLLKETRKRVAMEKEHETLSRFEKFKNNFISMMSHDLKTPIARIHGTAELLLGQASILPDKFRSSLHTIIDSSDDLLSFVNNILSVAKIESQSISLNRVSKDINNVIQGCVKDMEYLARTRKIRIECQLEPLFSIKIDVELVKKVISTLIENAIKYSPVGSVITLSSSELDNSYIRIKIRDRGAGIPREEQDLIFTKFYRGNRSRANPVKGTGLGLYLARYFVELHKGKIEFNSAPTAGSTFSVYLPVN